MENKFSSQKYTKSKNMKYKPLLAGFIFSICVAIIQLYFIGINIKGMTSITGTFVVVMSVAFLWTWMKQKALILIPVVASVDIDHFLFGSTGFFEHPEVGIKILHAFHSIEMLVLVLLLNVFIGMHTFKKGWAAWLFPRKEDYSTKARYYIAWTVRIIMLGVAIHYLMDIFIYTIAGKWGYYDYSVIHYLLTK